MWDPDPYSGLKGLDYASEPVTAEEYEQAQKLWEAGVRHPAVRELAEFREITPAELIEECELTIRNYNLAQRGAGPLPEEDGPPK